MPFRRAAFATLLLTSSLIPARARAAAWTEVHQTSGDVRMTVEPNGVASVEHTFSLRVVMGPIKSFDLVGVDRDAQLEQETAATAEDGRTLPAHVTQVELKPSEAARRLATRGQTVRVTIDDAKGLKRGMYAFHVRYKLDLVATRTIVRDGALWHFAWTAPVAPEGFDTARVVLDLPPAPTEPRPLRPSGEDGVLATLRRMPERDELELVRPHVSRGEAVTWEARIDPKALAAVSAPELRAPPRPPPPAPSRWIELGWLAALALVAAGFGALVHAKGRRMAKACAAGSLVERPLVPLPSALRPLFAAATLACGVAVQLLASPLAGSALIALAAAIAVFRAPVPRTRARGPGKWIAVDPSDLRGASPDDSWLDVGTTRGRVALAVAIAFACAAAVASRWVLAQGPYFVAIDAAALLPLWLSGRAVQLRHERARQTHAELLELRRLLSVRDDLRVTPWARIPKGGTLPDEIRLLALPREPLPGLIGIEVGFGLSFTPTGWLPTPQVLVRMHDGSAASSRLTSLRLTRAIGPGRAAHERVAAVAPADADLAQIRALVGRLGEELHDRRTSEPVAYVGPERRLPPEERPGAAPGPAS